MNKQFNYIEHYKIDAEEFNYFEERTGATLHDERRVHEYILSKVKNGAEIILDVGSGSAWVAKHYESDLTKIISFDISKNNVKKAKELVPKVEHIPLVGDSFHLPFGDNSIDIVIASEIIEHVVDPDSFVKELLRVAKGGGKVIVTTPYKEKLRFYLCVHCNKKTPVHAHIHSFDEKKLQSYSDKKINWETFGNKFLLFVRSYVLLKYLPFNFWKMVDKFANIVKNMPVHIIVEYRK